MKFNLHKLINLFKKKSKQETTINNCYYLNDIEYKTMKKLNSNVVKLSSTSIGIKVECFAKNEWVDITDYSRW